MSINRCDICSELDFPSCSDTITIDAGLSLAQDYYVWMTDKSGHKYNAYVQSEADGSLNITMSLFTDNGLSFTSSSGVYELSVSTSDTEDTSETITINGQEYPCVNITFYDLN